MAATLVLLRLPPLATTLLPSGCPAAAAGALEEDEEVEEVAAAKECPPEVLRRLTLATMTRFRNIHRIVGSGFPATMSQPMVTFWPSIAFTVIDVAAVAPAPAPAVPVAATTTPPPPPLLFAVDGDGDLE